MAVLFAGCSDQKATATRQRWMEIKTATENFLEEMNIANQSTPIKSIDQISESLARTTSTVNACRTYNEALSSQKTVNVDPQLNALAEKLFESSKELLTQMQKVQEGFITAQRLQTELQTADDSQKDRISLEADKISSNIDSAQQIGVEALMQISSHYQKLETLRLELNKQYGFELPQIK